MLGKDWHDLYCPIAGWTHAGYVMLLTDLNLQ